MKLKIIEACSDLGINIQGAKLGPKVLDSYLRKYAPIKQVISPDIVKSDDNLDMAKNIVELNKYNEHLYQAVLGAKRENKIPITIGGDHSIAISSALASIAEEKKLGILWIDTHPDFNTFKTTITGNIHGMPLATITKHNGSNLTPFHRKNWYLDQNTVIIGARDIDILEQKNLEEANIKVFTTKDLKENNIEDLVEESIKIALANTNGLHVSFDLDLLDPLIAPGVSVSFPNGINVEEAKEILRVVLKHKDQIKSFDFVEFNPLRDQNQRTEKIAIQILEMVLSELGK